MSTLAERRRMYDIPAVPYLPMAKNVLIYRLPEEERTSGGIIVPDVAKDAKDKGVLLAAGLTARDILADHLVEIGDIVWFARYAGSEREVSRDSGGTSRKILQVKVEDILGSVDALERVAAYRIDRNEEGEHVYVHAPANDNGVDKRQANGRAAK